MKRLRFALLLALLGGAGAFLYKQRLGAAAAAPATAPQWPPLREDQPPAAQSFAAARHDVASSESSATTTAAAAAPIVTTNEPTTTGVDAAATQRWVPPVDGGCPDGYPVKANDNSGIFHVPGGRFYARTVPERCYATADDAIADGYRAAKA
jgi:hypothetical protein